MVLFLQCVMNFRRHGGRVSNMMVLFFWAAAVHVSVVSDRMNMTPQMCTVSRHAQKNPRLEVCEYPAGGSSCWNSKVGPTLDRAPWQNNSSQRTQQLDLWRGNFYVEWDCRPVVSTSLTNQSGSLIKQNLHVTRSETESSLSLLACLSNT